MLSKKSMAKIGAISILVIVALIVLLIFILPLLGLAISNKESYVLGEEIKFNFENLGDYKLKIITPSTSFVRVATNDFFIFKPEETGNYTLQLFRGFGKKEYFFEVLKNSTQEQDRNITIENYGSGWSEKCSKGECVRSVHSGSPNILDSNGEFKPFTEVVNFTKEEEEKLEVRWKGKNITLDAEAIIGGKKKKIPSSMNFITILEETQGAYKWTHKFTNINNLEAIVLYIKSEVGINRIDKDTFLIGEILLDFSDLYNRTCKLDEDGQKTLCTESGIAVESKQINENESEIKISNFSGKEIELDPTVTSQYQNPGSDNLNDAYVYSRSGYTNLNYGQSTDLNVRSRTDRIQRSYIMFNISALPSDATVYDAQLCLFLYSDGGTTGITALHVRAYNWSEGSLDGIDATGQGYQTNITWANQPCGTTLSGTSCNRTMEDYKTTNPGNNNWVCWNITKAVKRDFAAGYKNVSFVLNSTENTGSNDGADTFYSKEHATAGERPYLNITYNYNAAPNHTAPIISSTFGTNGSEENITVYNQSTVDLDGTVVRNIINWYLDGRSILLLNLPFEGGSNSSWAKDYSGYGHNATQGTSANQPTYNITGGYDRKGAYELATNDYFNISATEALKLRTANFTVSAWTYVTGTTQQMFLYHGFGCSTWSSYFLSIGGNENEPQSGNYAFGFGTSNAATNNNVYSTSDALTNSWVFLTATYDGATLSLYVNGVLNNTATASGTPWNSLEDLYIGADPGCGLRDPLNGKIDEVRIYNRSLTAVQIKELYNNRTDLIVAEETSIGQVWSACISPNDGVLEGPRLCSSNLTVLFVDSFPPSGTLFFPLPGAIVDELPVNLTVNASDNYALKNATLFIYNSTGSLINQTTRNISGTNTLLGIEYSFPYYGLFNWSYLIYDNSSSKFYTNNNTINFTSGAPLSVTINLPTNTTYNDNHFPLNFEVVLNKRGSSVKYEINDDGNVSMSSTNNLLYNATNSSMVDGAYRFMVYANSTAGNSNYTTYVDFTVDINMTPTHTTPVLSATTVLNSTDDNLTVYNQSTYDADLDYVKNIINWYLNNVSISVLNLPFEGGSNSSWTKDYSGYGHNATQGTSANQPVFNRTAGYDTRGAMQFTTNDYLTISATQALKLRNVNFTVSAWTYVTATTQQMFLYHGLGCSTWSSYILSIGGNEGEPQAGKYAFGFGTANAATDRNVYSTGNAYTNRWVFLTATYNGTTLSLYINGVLNNTATASGIPWDSLENLYIGADPGCGLRDPVNGKIDEVRIFNRSLTAVQIKELYNNRTDLIVAEETSVGQVWSACISPNDGILEGTRLCSSNLTVAVQDSIPPNATLIAPQNATTNSTALQNFTVNVTDNLGVKNTTLYIYNQTGLVFNETRILNGVTTSIVGIVYTFLYDGVFSWFYKVFDQAGLSFTTENRTIAMQVVPPAITIVSPASGSTINDVTPLLNVSATDSNNVSAMWYTVNLGATNQTLCNNCTGYKNAFLYFAEGARQVTVYANDSYGNVNFSTSSFTIDMNKNYYDSFLDNSSLLSYTNITWGIGNVSYRRGFLVPSRDVQLLFHFNNDSYFTENSTKAYDFSSYGRNGSVSGGAYWNLDGKYFGAYNLSSTTSSISVASSDVLNYDNHTVSFWIYFPRAASSNWDQIFAYRPSGTDRSPGVWLNPSALCMHWKYNPGNLGPGCGGPTGESSYFSQGTWYHVTGVKNDATFSFYVNGAAVINTTVPAVKTAGASILSLGLTGFNSAIFKMDEFIIFNRSLNNSEVGVLYNYSKDYYSGSLGNFTAYPINTTNLIARITNITWQEDNTNTNNNITVQISVDNGITWFNASKGEQMESFSPGTSLVYRVFFNTNEIRTISLLDMNISWSNETNPPPGIIINSPLNGTTIADVTPTLNITLNGTANSLWYTIDNGVTNQTLCTSCTGEKITFLYLEEGNFNVLVYANNTINELSSNRSSFTIDMNNNYYDTFDDNSSIIIYNNVTWNFGNISYRGGAQIPPTDVQILYHFNNNSYYGESSSVVNDFSSYGRDGTVSGAYWNLAGKYNGGYNFSSTVSSITVSSSNVLNNDNHTVSFWIYFPTAATANWDQIFAYVPSGNDRSPSLWLNPSALCMHWKYNPGNTGPSCAGPTGEGSYFSQSTWYHVTGVKSDGSFSFYVNGNAVINTSVAATKVSGSSVFYLGDSPSYNSGVFLIDEFVVYNRSLNYSEVAQMYNLGKEMYSNSATNLTSYSINTTSSITEITNVSWQESGIDSMNNLSVEISPDNGANWYFATNGEGLISTALGNSLVYRVNFVSNGSTEPTLFDMNITWSNQVSLPPNISINSPVNSSTLPDVTPTLNVTVIGVANNLWYTTNGGITNTTLCTSCTGEQTAFLYLKEGNFKVIVYADNALGALSSNSSNFTIDMNYNYYDTFDDNSSVIFFNNITWYPGNFSFIGGAQTTPADVQLLFHFNNYSYYGESSSLVYDFSSYNRNGTVTGAYWDLAGKYNGAYNFSSTASSISVASSDVLNNDNHTISFWIYFPRATDASWRQIFAYVPSGNDRSPSLWLNPSALCMHWKYNPGNTGPLCAGPTGESSYFSQATWYHVTGVKSDGSFSFYVNGNAVINMSVAATKIAGSSAFYLGDSPSYDSGFFLLDEFVVYNRSLNYSEVAQMYNLGKELYSNSQANFTAYPINTTSSITEITNITWQDAGTDSGNNITVKLSIDGGRNWYDVNKSEPLTGFSPNNSLVYRVIFNTNETRTISLLDMNISWTSSTFSPPNITINSPANGTSIADVTPTLNITLEGTANSLWYTLNGGATNITLCTSCTGEKTAFLYLKEGSFNVTVYANNPLGAKNSNSTSFTIDMNNNYYDTFDDNSSLITYNNVTWRVGNISYTGTRDIPPVDVQILYHFNNDSYYGENDSRVYDFSSYLRNGSVSSVYFNSSGKYNGDYSFNTITSSVSVPSSNVLNYDNHTVSFWIYFPQAASANWDQIFAYRPSGTDRSPGVWLNQNALCLHWKYSPGNLGPTCGGPTGETSYFSQRTWYHITGVKQDANFNFYVNGAAVINTTVPAVKSAGASILSLGQTAYNSAIFKIDEYIIYNRSLNNSEVGALYNYGKELYSTGSGNFTAYPINTTRIIKQISNITWAEDGTDGIENNISVLVSIDGGKNWSYASQGGSVTGFLENNSLVYSVKFTSNGSRTLTLLDMNITWSEPPIVSIVYPTSAVYPFFVQELNYSIVLPFGSILDTCWWRNDTDPTKNYITCGQNVTGMNASEGNNTWWVYANDTEGAIGYDSVTFKVDLSAPQIGFINQTDEEGKIVNSTNELEQGENLTINVNVTEENIDQVWVVVWQTVKDGAQKLRRAFTYVGGILWTAIIPTDSSWESVNYLYTIYANDTTGYTNEFDGNFPMVHLNLSIDLSPNPSPGSGGVAVFGKINFSNGTDFVYRPINIWLNGNLLLLANLTPNEAYNNYLNFTDTDSNDFNKGTFYQTETDGENVTLLGSNTTGNFSRILDAGARVQWNSIEWDSIGTACSGTLTYQEGFDGYSGTKDSYLNSQFSNTNYGTTDSLLMDTDPYTYRGLIKFYDILGPGGSKIPFNSTIHQANISVQVYDAGNQINVYQVLENWEEEQASYNYRLTGISWGSSGCAGTPSRATSSESSFTPASAGSYTFDITNAFKKWTNHSYENYGLVLSPVATNDVFIRSSEYSTDSERPKLTVRFDSDDCTSAVVYVRTSNDKINWTSWQAVNNNGTINDPNTASRYLEYNVVLSSLNSSSTPYFKFLKANYTAVVTNATGGYNYNFSSPTVFGSYIVSVNSSYKTITSGISKTLIVQAGVSPVVNLSSPITSIWFNYSEITLFYNASDGNGDFSNSTLFINGIANATNSSTILNGELNNFTVNFSSGQYNWSVEARDWNNNLGYDGNWTFYVDLLEPNVTLVYPAQEQGFTVSNLNLSFNATDNLDSLLNCFIVLDGSVLNSSVFAVNGNITNVSSGLLLNGIHYWNVTCLDQVNRSYTSETWTFNITDTPPQVTLEWPNNDYLDGVGNISFIFNASDNSGFINCSLIINDTLIILNQTAINLTGNTTINATNLGEGDYNWTVECFDLSGTSDISEKRNFSVDLNFPTIQLNAPGNGVTINYSSVSFNFTANDTIDSNLSCSLTVNSEVIGGTFFAEGGQLTNVNANNITDGLKYWNVSCMDDAWHLNTSNTWTLNILEPPRIVLTTPNQTYSQSDDIFLAYTPFDNTNLSSCNLYIDGVFNMTNSSAVANSFENLFFATNVRQGMHTWYVNCSDYANLSSVSEERTFYIDSFPPNITLIFPNGDDVYATNITFNFTVLDSVSANLLCNLSVDGDVKDFNFNVTNGTIVNRTVSGLSDSNHTWHVNCTDPAGNSAGSLIYNFTKFTSPLVFLYWPTDGYWFNSSFFNLTYYTEHDMGIANSTLYINGVVNRTNSTQIVNYNYNNFSIEGFADGRYNWTVSVTSNNKMSSTATPEWIFYVDTFAPQLILNYPNQSEFVTTNNITFNFSVWDNLDENISCDVYLDGENEYSRNVSNGTSSITYLLIPDGNHTWNVTCWDDAYNYNNSESINFTVKAPPNVTLDAPEEGNITANSTLRFFYTPIDPIDIVKCDLWGDFNGTWHLNQTDNSPIENQQNNFTVHSVKEGYRNWTVNCTDPDSNSFQPDVRTFTLDSTPPRIILMLPINDSGIDFNEDNITFWWNATDVLDSQLQCRLFIDGVQQGAIKEVTSGTPYQEDIDTLTLGGHYWNVTCWDRARNTNTSSPWIFNFTYPDFFINLTYFVFNTSAPAENDLVLLNATILNKGGADVDSFVVKFYDGDPDLGGTQINGNVTLSILKYNRTYANVTWTADTGNSNLFVVLDPPIATNGSIHEWNESNNEANRTLTVGSWYTLYGNVTSESIYVLDNDNNSRVVKWLVNDSYNGSIFIADYESEISWGDLLAIGKNISGGNTSNDFTDIDTLLGMTSYTDSVSNVFTDSGTIRDRENFLVFQRYVNYVAVANSTNNTNFVTGILWDMDDDSDGQFSQADTEDLVFVSKVNQGALGAYGNYDYEVRVPAALRMYQGTDSEAAIYIELY